MKKGLLGSTALIGATVLMAGAASAAEAPEWNLSGNTNFQIYLPSQDSPPAAAQDRAMYFGVDESEMAIKASGSTDNGLDYGLKVELQTNTDDGTVADEARISIGGSWGTVLLGDEDGAEDAMNYGGENLMGATGGFDGDQDDWYTQGGSAPGGPGISGDSGDATKITYYSPRTSGIQAGVSYAPQDSSGDNGATDAGTFENYIGLGVNYDGEMGGMRVRASAVYATASDPAPAGTDLGAFQVGGIVNFGQIAVGANYADNGDANSSFFDVAASFSQGPIGLSIGYFSSTADVVGGEDTLTNLSLTADYSMAPGLGVYAEVSMISSEDFVTPANDNDGTGIILGANVSF